MKKNQALKACMWLIWAIYLLISLTVIFLIATPISETGSWIYLEDMAWCIHLPLAMILASALIKLSSMASKLPFLRFIFYSTSLLTIHSLLASPGILHSKGAYTYYLMGCIAVFLLTPNNICRLFKSLGS